MSLILEALKKLEREKEAGARGFVVLSHLPWAREGSGPRTMAGSVVAIVITLVALAAVGTAVWRWRGAGTPAVTVPAPVLSPTAAPSAPDPGAAMPSGRIPPAGQLDTRPVAIRPPVPPASPSTPPKPADAESHAAAKAPAGQEPAVVKGVELRLNAISVKDGRPVAILNDRLVREGDSFDGIRVLRIGDAEDEVEVAGERRTLRF